MTKQEEINKLREKLLRLGQPIIIPANEQRQVEVAGDNSPRDITLYPVFEEEVDAKAKR